MLVSIFLLSCVLAVDIGHIPDLAKPPQKENHAAHPITDGCRMNGECEDNQVCRGGVCVHKAVFPFTSSDTTMCGALILTTVIAAAGGIGGGGLIVPILIFLGSFTTHDATQLSQIAMFGISVGNFVINCQKRHPTADRPLIDYDSALLLEPSALLGTVVGVIVNKISPSWLVLLLSTLLCCYSTVHTTKKAWSMYKSEQEEESIMMHPLKKSRGDGNEVFYEESDTMEDFVSEERANPHSRSRKPSSASLDENKPVHQRLHNDFENEGSEEDDPSFHENNAILLDMLERERKTPWKVIFCICLIWLAVLAISLVKGGKLGPITCGSEAYWALAAALVPVTALPLLYQRSRLLAIAALKAKIAYHYHPGDVAWTGGRTGWGVLGFVAAGLSAGALGVGGGVLQGPIMTEMGMLPQTVQATSTFMVLFTTAALSAQFLIIGLDHQDYALLFFIMCSLCSAIGTSAVHSLVKRFRSASLLTAALALSIGVSAIAMGASGIITVLDDLRQNRSLGFHSIC